MNAARWIAGRLGYDLVNKRRSHLRLEHHLGILLRKLRIDCVIDVGANRGQFGAMLRGLGYRGRIASFEPLAPCRAALEERAKGDSAWQVHPLALGAAPGRRRFRELEFAELSSFLAPADAAAERFGPGARLRGEREVEVHRLDELFPRITEGLPAPRVFLKMDTQGFDLEVFRGAAGCLERVAALQSEMSVLPLYEGMPDYLEALAAYRAGGFEVTGFYPVFRERESLVIGEFDCVMARRPAPRP